MKGGNMDNITFGSFDTEWMWLWVLALPFFIYYIIFGNEKNWQNLESKPGSKPTFGKAGKWFVSIVTLYIIIDELTNLYTYNIIECNIYNPYMWCFTTIASIIETVVFGFLFACTIVIVLKILKIWMDKSIEQDNLKKQQEELKRQQDEEDKALIRMAARKIIGS